MAGTGDRGTGVRTPDESYEVVTVTAMSDRPAQGSYMQTCAPTAHGHFAAGLGGHMPSSTPDWSALASQNERLADRVARGGKPEAASRSTGQRETGHGDTQILTAVPWLTASAATCAAGPRTGAAPRRSLLRRTVSRRPGRRAVAGTAAVLAIAGATSVSAAAAQASVRPGCWLGLEDRQAGARRRLRPVHRRRHAGPVGRVGVRRRGQAHRLEAQRVQLDQGRVPR